MGKYETNKTKLCKHCQTEIPYKAKVCPNCRRRVKGGKLKWLLAVAVIAILASSFISKRNQSKKEQAEVNNQPPETVIMYTEPNTIPAQESEPFQEMLEVHKIEETQDQFFSAEETYTEMTEISGMRPEFIEAMDSYEDFYDGYCDLLEKYSKNPADLKLLAQYSEMLLKVEKMDSAFKEWDEKEMNDGELKYYLDVNNRVMKRLLDASSVLSK